MKTQCVVALSLFGAVASLALVATQAPAQDKGFKEAITGAWLITAVYDEYQNGEKKDNWGGPVQGQITFGRTGRFTQIIVGPPVASMKTPDPRKPDAPVVAYYGSYTVDEAGKKVIGKIEGASYSPRANTETTWTVQGSGDKLTLIGNPRQDQNGTFSPKLEVKRP
ncbi:MAG: lipocalin-like domain-containing protein [Xanthobacteraceae bacterium]|nr:lipocalin-like domain-containing protein [Xanthobacteraceae bacterium]MBV9629863.1 lipocalin-like domain-containing protein [Xanthobacteraceae bacterium]